MAKIRPGKYVLEVSTVDAEWLYLVEASTNKIIKSWDVNEEIDAAEVLLAAWEHQDDSSQ